MAKNRSEAPKSLGRDELNLAEFPLSLIGKRAPAGAKTLHFSDEVYDRSLGRMVTRKLTVTASDLLGLPTAVDDEVLLGCLQLSKLQNFAGARVTFTRRELLKLLGWRLGGKDYRRLSESLNRWAGTLVISENAFWDRGEQRWVNDTFTILDRVYVMGKGKAERGNDLEAYFVWGDFMWRNIAAGNLRTLDFEFVQSLQSTIARRLYRLLSKRFHHGRKIKFELKRLAFDKVGLSRNMHTGQIKEKLAKGHVELESRGVCHSQFIEKSRGNWEVVYTALQQETKTIAKEPDPLCEALLARGVKNGTELVAKFAAERIESAIENYDDRRQHGEEIGPGWLGKCITHSTGFNFRKGYRTKAELAADAQRKRKREEAKEQAATVKRLQARKTRGALDQFLASLGSDAERDEFAVRALANNRYLRDFYEISLRTNDRGRASRHRRDAMLLLWEKERPKNTE